ncbi:EAL domain-containing protein [Pseudomonas panipatensis]|uniref:cyclic-guanylate-specific phosphodiesterase n=1 Tax=Pseudomonas panipatensis TaxID=428992 RepID=A0A1G8EAL8_9PSED|nr:PAS domain S-box-containing protein/diguanylate cyclase (GGDEF) domain-containing protein [Pseudomonas panipatensis]SMP37711.1 diguanylate cyclase/phosphodiesterase with PAS/PAC sensor(s) [Pseudomonas panipatensis]
MSKPSRSPASLARPGRLATKSGLLLLVLLMLGLLLWQLRQEYVSQERFERERVTLYGQELARQLSLMLELKALAARTLASQRLRLNEEPATLMGDLGRLYPALRSLVWLDRDGRPQLDTAPGSADDDFIGSLLRRSNGRAFYYSYSESAGGLVYVLLRPEDSADGPIAILRIDANESRRQWEGKAPLGTPPWLLEDANGKTIFSHPDDSALPPPVSVESGAGSQRLDGVSIANSDWQVRPLLDPSQASRNLLPRLAGELALLLMLGGVTCAALWRLQREQQNLRALTADSQSRLRQAAQALAAIDERVLVTRADGRLAYLNPQAEQLFGIRAEDAERHYLMNLLPGLGQPSPPDGAQPATGTELVSLEHHGRLRVFAVSHHALDDSQLPAEISWVLRGSLPQGGNVWVLRDVTEEQRSLQVLEETRRRYQDIFDGVGVALCVLDLAALREFLIDNGLRDEAALQDWLDQREEHWPRLLRLIRVSEINDVAKGLLGVSSSEQAWRHLIGGTARRPGSVRVRLIVAVLSGASVVEQEVALRSRQGELHHFWLQVRMPERPQDFGAVTLSLSDISSRKQIELSLIEREKFWSDAVRAVPDTLYIQEIPSRRVLFSNHHLGIKLGYSDAELEHMGEQFWELLLHPDDAEYYWRVRNLQQVIGDSILLDSQMRWRHRDGSWHWFDIREQAFSRDAEGRVARLIGVVKDITESVEASNSLRESSRRYQMLAESISDVILTTDARLNIDYISPSIQQTFGYSPEWLLQNGFQNVATNPIQLARLNALLERVRDAIDAPQRLAALRESSAVHLFNLDCLRADGRKIPVDLRIALMWDDHGRFVGLLGVARDISQQRRAEREMRMAATVFEHSTAAIMVTDPAGYIVQVNDSFSRLTGYTAAEVLDQQPRLLTADRQEANQLKHVLDSLQLSGSWEGEILQKRKSGELYPSWVGITAVQDEEGDLVSFVCFFSDISERKASERRIHRLAYYDALTHLPNRTLFQDRLHTALTQAERHRQWVVLMFLDLDRFKPINDSLGHAAGDRMLKEVAERLSHCVSDTDTVARMGGDEFTLLLPGRVDRESALKRAIQVAEQILASLARPFTLEGREFFVTASIGVALSPQDGAELSQLMKNADTAMYHAKEVGKNNFQFYQAEMNARALERLELESDLRRAIEQNEFILHYQPQFTGDGRRLTGAEALLRWRHPRRGLIPPTEFVPVLEELGLIAQVGDWLLAEACQQLKTWHRDKVRVPKVSVNLSARQFADGQLGTRIAAILAETGIAPACLELELTESILMNDVSQAMHILSGLKQLGLAIAVDDFGTGYSSLNYLKQYPIDVLKIDRSFVDGLPHGEQDAQIARAIIAMAHSLNLMAIAEGVESQEQLDFLREHGCDEVQGFLFGRPMSPEQFAALFSSNALFLLG